MTIQQWVNVMRKAGCVIYYESMDLGNQTIIRYSAINKSTKWLIGTWYPQSECGSIIVNNHTIMSWEFAE